MALITLPNGKTIDVDIFWYLSLSDQDYQDLIAMNVGFEIENPFHGSCLNGRIRDMEERDEDGDPPPVDGNNSLELVDPDDI